MLENLDKTYNDKMGSCKTNRGSNSVNMYYFSFIIEYQTGIIQDILILGMPSKETFGTVID